MKPKIRDSSIARRMANAREGYLTGEIPLEAVANAHFGNRKVLKVWFQNPLAWVFQFDSGPPVYLEPVAPNGKVKSFMCGEATDMSAVPGA